MNKIKKLILGLAIIVGMMLTAVIGVASTPNGKVKQNPVGNQSNNTNATVVEESSPVVKVEKPKVITYSADQISIQKGVNTIDYFYSPNVNTKAATVTAYEYIFGNPMDRATAVNLKEIDTTDVTVSYVWSSTKLTTTDGVTSYTDYECQTIENEGDKVYIYVLVTPTNTSIPTTFTTSIVWYYGIPMEVTISNNINSATTTQTIVTGQAIDKNTLTVPEAPAEGYYFDAWYLDEDFTQMVYKDEVKPTQKLYARFHNLPSTQYSEYNSDGYYTLAIPYSGDIIVPALWNDGTNGEAEVRSLTGGNRKSYGTIQFSCTLRSFGYSLFEESSIQDVDFRACVNLEEIKNWAFYGVYGLTSIDLSNCKKLKIIGSQAFYAMNFLEIVKIPESIEIIVGNPFVMCSRLTYNIYNNGKYLGNDANPYIVYMGYVDTDHTSWSLFHSNTKIIVDNALDGISFASPWVSIPNSVVYIGESIFMYNYGAETFSISDNIKMIGKNAFYGLSSPLNFTATGTWYVTQNREDWLSKTGGTAIEVTSSNAKDYLTNTYLEYYWYR